VTSLPEAAVTGRDLVGGRVRYVRVEAPLLIVGGAACAWFAVISALVLRLHSEFGTGRFDLGNMAQAVWSTSHGRPLEMTMANGEQMSRLAVHVDPILVAFTPLRYIGPIPELLVTVQALALATGAIPVYLLARRYLDSTAAALLCAFVYLLNPWVAWIALFDFHAVALAIPLLLYSVYFLFTERWVAFGFVISLALLTQELIGITVTALGLWYAIQAGRRRIGIVIAAIGAGWTAICLYLIIPMASSGSASPFYNHFEEVGGSPAGVVKTLITDPQRLVSSMTSARDLAYLAVLLLPVAGIAIWAPTMLLVAGPQLAVNMLAAPSSTTSPAFQYSAAVLPFVFAATVLGLARFEGKRRRLLGASSVCLVAFACALALGPVKGAPAIAGGSRSERDLMAARTPAHQRAMQAAVALVPANVAVSATNYLGAHLSERHTIYSVPVIRYAEWIVVDRSETFVPAIPGRVTEGRRPMYIRRFQSRIETGAEWKRVFGRDDVFVYRRRH
jgi:uncharacterized membrane protein